MIGPIGVDLDNTLVSYDDVLHLTALEHRLIGREVSRGKKSVRDAVRLLSEGDIKWQNLQAEIYGPRMSEAKLIEGVTEFFKECRLRSISVYIVSHKTEFAGYDRTGTNLRLKAMDWLTEHGFFESDCLGLSREQVFFESTREEKIERIKSLDCTHFIDDLEETFLEDSFPVRTMKILFDPHHFYLPRPGIRICSSWREIAAHLFGG